MVRSAIQKGLLTAALCGLVTVAGCSSAQPPKASVSRAQLAIRGAELSKASQYAPLEMRKARDKLSEGESAMSKEDYLTARRLAEQALVDALLAEVKAESAIARQNATDLQKAIKSLSAEAERGLGK